MKISQKLTALAALTAATTAFSAPLTIEQQGTFAVGGTVVTSKGEYNARPRHRRDLALGYGLAVANSGVAKMV